MSFSFFRTVFFFICIQASHNTPAKERWKAPDRRVFASRFSRFDLREFTHMRTAVKSDWMRGFRESKLVSSDDEKGNGRKKVKDAGVWRVLYKTAVPLALDELCPRLILFFSVGAYNSDS